MTIDKNKGITGITYNHLNLPIKITFGTTGNIVYVYNATGQKLKKVVTQGTTVTTTDYLGGYQYVNNALQFFPTAEGYVSLTGTTYSYTYQYKDHLGNIRLSYSDANNDKLITNNEIVEESNYYPFGLKQTGYNNVTNSLGNSSAQKYKYNGKELQDELGLNMTAMDWRQYDAAIGKWIAQDPIVHLDVSPYTAFNNNPVYWADPSGLKGSASGQRDGEMVGADGMTGSEWLASERRRIDKMMGGSGIDIGSMTYSTAQLRKQKQKENENSTYVFPEGELIWNDWNSSSEVFRISTENAVHVYYASWLTSKFGKAQGGGGGFDGYNYADGIGQLANAATVVWGATQLGVDRLRQFNLASKVAPIFGIGTQVAAPRLKAFTNTLGAWGKRVGSAGVVLSGGVLVYKYANNQTISTAEAVGFGIGAGFLVAGSIVAGTAAAPFVATAALVYGALELGSYATTGQSLEQHIFKH
jgi:RHS repeat-associated protein